MYRLVNVIISISRGFALRRGFARVVGAKPYYLFDVIAIASSSAHARAT